MITRTIAGVAVFACFLAILVLDRALEMDLFLGIMILTGVTLAVREFYLLCERNGLTPFTTFGTVCAFLFTALAWIEFGGYHNFGVTTGGALVPGCLAAALFGCFILQAGKQDNAGLFESIGATMFGILYVWFLAIFLIKIRHLGGGDWLDKGTRYVFYTVMAVKASDIGAYAVGSAIGRHKLCPSISPNKSVEGFFGGLASSVLTAAVIKTVIFAGYEFLDWAPLIAITLAISIVAVLGDLAESMMKRRARVKDSSKTLPGFGGLLDIMDSLLPAMPVAYFLLITVGGA